MSTAAALATAGARTTAQVDDNTAASELAPLPESTRATIARLYNDKIAPEVHQRW